MRATAWIFVILAGLMLAGLVIGGVVNLIMNDPISALILMGIFIFIGGVWGAHHLWARDPWV